jgi:hypothetical protein
MANRREAPGREEHAMKIDDRARMVTELAAALMTSPWVHDVDFDDLKDLAQQATRAALAAAKLIEQGITK